MTEPTTEEIIHDLRKPVNVTKFRTWADGVHDDAPGLAHIMRLADLQAQAADRLALLSRQVEEAQEKLDIINRWAKAYPLSAFPEPDLRAAHEALLAAGITLDAVSASAVRHVMNEIITISDKESSFKL